MMWAVVEIMGHRTRAGSVSDATIGGAPLLLIEHPTRTNAEGDGPLEEYYAPQAIFAIRPCSRDEATKVAEWSWSAPGVRQALPAAAELAEVIEDGCAGYGNEHDDGDDECAVCAEPF